MSTGYFGKRELLYLDNLYWGLITSSHILHKHGIFDAYGHVSVRNPDNDKTFFLPMNKAPALLTSAEEIVEYNIDDGEPTDKADEKHFSERFIHSEIYKKFPTINAVVHSHCSEVLPYCINNVPLKAPIHTAGFLGSNPVPVWDISSVYSSSDKRHDLLVRTPAHGHSLAASFKPAKSTTYIYSAMRSALPDSLTGSTLPEASDMLTHPVVLMRGHGFTTAAESLEAAVYQAIYTKEAAKVNTSALLTRDAWGDEEVVGSVDVQGSGKIKDGKVKQSGKGLKVLTEREARDAAVFSRETVMRPWEMWVRETEVDSFYANTAKKDEQKN